MFAYYDPPGEFPDARAYVAVVPAGLSDIVQLMTVLGEKLRFPVYYGRNLDAFWDCATDLANIDAHRVLLVHRDLPDLPERERRAYIELLRDTAVFWQGSSRAHSFEAWFPRGTEETVEAVLASLPPDAPEWA